jgi:uncharacterized protein YbbC (DUF1343 family)
LVGAPWIDAEPFADALNRRHLPGVHFRPVVFEPTFQKHARLACGGCQIHVTDRGTFRAVETGVALIEAFRAAGDSKFAWRDPPYEYEHSKMPIDILYGSSELREALAAGRSAPEIAAGWAQALDSFRQLRETYLLY